jgi:hypothetical protein
VPAVVEQMQLACEIERKEAEPRERHCGGRREPRSWCIARRCSQLEWPLGKLRKPSRRIKLFVCVQMCQSDNPSGGSVAPNFGIQREMISARTHELDVGGGAKRCGVYLVEDDPP